MSGEPRWLVDLRDDLSEGYQECMVHGELVAAYVDALLAERVALQEALRAAADAWNEMSAMASKSDPTLAGNKLLTKRTVGIIGASDDVAAFHAAAARGTAALNSALDALPTADEEAR